MKIRHITLLLLFIQCFIYKYYKSPFFRLMLKKGLLWYIDGYAT